MQAGCNWWLNNKELIGTNTRVSFTSANLTSAGSRQSIVDLHTRGQFRERVGNSIPKKHLEISFLTTGGDGGEKWDLMAEVLAVLENDEVWTLQAPTNYYVFKNVQRAAFSTLGEPRQDDERGINKITLTLDACVNGVWVADGGGYCEPVGGYFISNDLVMYLNDEVNPGGTYAFLRLPKQASGYPQARKTDFTWDIPPLLSSLTIDGLPYEVYNMFNYIHPHAATLPQQLDGVARVFEVCQSPNLEFLDGATGSGQATGQESGGIGSFPVAEQEASG